MKIDQYVMKLAALAIVGTLGSAEPTAAQMDGSAATTPSGTNPGASEEVSSGWSVTKRLLGTAVYDESGRRIGRVEDFVVARGAGGSHLIVSTGGFAGIGRHDVAISVRQFQDRGGRLVLSGGTLDTLLALPSFVYATDLMRRDAYVAAAHRDLSAGRQRMTDLEQASGAATGDGLARIVAQITSIRGDMLSTEAGMHALLGAKAARWPAFEADLGTAAARLRRSIALAIG